MMEIGRRSAARISVSMCATVVLAVAAASCGGSDGSLSEAGARGKRIATASGCVSCHGGSGQGGVGPKWQDLARSEVTLRDGTTIIADEEYLVRSITDPGADLLKDFDLQMPKNRLNEREVADVVAYINDLSAP